MGLLLAQHAYDQAFRRGQGSDRLCRSSQRHRSYAAGNFNPYKIGIELFRDIEDRWNKGKFGKEYDESTNLGEKRKWDKGLGQGREKIFEVRRIYNDVNFIDEFMTPEFIEKHKFYQYGRDPHTGQLRIVSRDPQRIKQTMLYHLTNMGQPFIYVADGNYCNRGELYLATSTTGSMSKSNSRWKHSKTSTKFGKDRSPSGEDR